MRGHACPPYDLFCARTAARGAPIAAEKLKRISSGRAGPCRVPPPKTTILARKYRVTARSMEALCAPDRRIENPIGIDLDRSGRGGGRRLARPGAKFFAGRGAKCASPSGHRSYRFADLLQTATICEKVWPAATGCDKRWPAATTGEFLRVSAAGGDNRRARRRDSHNSLSILRMISRTYVGAGGEARYNA